MSIDTYKYLLRAGSVIRDSQLFSHLNLTAAQAQGTVSSPL